MNPGMKPYFDQIVPILKDLSEQPETAYLLVLNSMFIPVDMVSQNEELIEGFVGRDVVVAFSTRETGWILLRRKDLILVPRTEIEEINAVNAQRREELNKSLHDKYHPKCGEEGKEEPPLDPRATRDPLWFRGQAL